MSFLAEMKIRRFLDTVGDGTGSRDAAVDGSNTPIQFKLTSEPGRSIELDRFTVYITDRGNLLPDKYGKDIVMTNGILLEIQDGVGNVVLDMLDGAPVKTNFAWQIVCFDTDSFQGKTPNDISAATFRWIVSDKVDPLTLINGQSLVATIRDDLTTLEHHSFYAQGEITEGNTYR